MSMNPTLLLSFSDYEQQAKALAVVCGIPYDTVQLHRFPDGESQLTLPVNLAETVIVCRSLDDPNHKLVELMLTAQSLRQHGVKRIILVAPYLCYMRQDKAFHPGEVVSQTIVGHFLADLFDAVITVDSHLHRISELNEAIPLEQAINLTATQPMAEFIEAHFTTPLLLGPDGESEQWVKEIATHFGFDYAVAHKQRLGDHNVVVTLPENDYARRNIIIVDDVASTGKTLLEAAKKLMPYQPASVSVLVSHALFIEDAIAQLNAAGVKQIYSCDSIPHQTNSVSLANILAKALQGVLQQ
ncbi:ribose-phosphate diphosphokinase [Methylophaga sp. UBA678]|uniref:ribose-phosphate diphosphokinase n=1 Tax=Methylophaga sp. UBA678 TaxID=1946901 RepID=UPI00259CA888|nr:ribose-phosphate diphosphokinase [Methylophaga sp. UBA678]|tara:strand:- start:25797 stop:26693 length:897 start_codon:yes stop_codon:yes gene_type:complete